MLKVTPVFDFNGRCEEAIELYQRAFGAEVKLLLRYSDADEKDFHSPLTEAQKNMIYHSEIMVGDQRMMLADTLDYELKSGVSQFLTITFDTADEVKRAYEVLEVGGTVIYPLHSTTYSSCMGSLIDQFGFRWGLMTETA